MYIYIYIYTHTFIYIYIYSNFVCLSVCKFNDKTVKIALYFNFYKSSTDSVFNPSIFRDNFSLRIGPAITPELFEQFNKRDRMEQF